MMDKLDLEGLASVAKQLIAERQDDPKFTATAEALLQFIAELRAARKVVELARRYRRIYGPPMFEGISADLAEAITAYDALKSGGPDADVGSSGTPTN